ncbi:MAG: hypothetical protein LPJ89_09495 [Hymenobacteraceae bacterium]|nr:hypothetical protein [Hymenobacteraceae bacterium]MDX5394958.1 hypothetical protein [Hymenobacteraceae bacterium]MDX5443999.1 hypothetical protein [Hymenobacteraceae bacterium]MDX5510992.1 hypothetical protein [Hymenobacteraceae bacterium]
MEEVILFIIELLKISLPALIVAGAMYYLVKNYLDRDMQRRLIELKMKNSDTVLPIRLQAFERMMLFLERITPSNLMIRVAGAGKTAQEYQRILLSEIRNEYNHNLSQQIYMSEAAWQQVKKAKEDVVTMINKAYHELPENARGTELAKRVLETIIANETDPTARAIVALKQEINQVF